MEASKNSSTVSFLLLLFIHLHISKPAQCYNATALFSLDSTLFTNKITNRQSTGLAGESCLSPNSCSRPDSCVRGGSSTCPDGGPTCVCGFPTCTDDSDCLSGESCRLAGDKKYCLSRNSRLKERDGALTFGSCKTSADCATNRDCFELVQDKFVFCRPGSAICSCLPLTFVRCDTSSDCFNGEVCNTSVSPAVCVDPVVIKGSSSANTTKSPGTTSKPPKVTATPKPVEQFAIPVTTTEPAKSTSSNESSTPAATSSPRGLTLDQCHDDKACAANRRCERPQDGRRQPCNSAADPSCSCIPPIFEVCGSPTDCTTLGETCVRLGILQFCVSTTTAQITENGETIEIVDSGDSTDPGTKPGGLTYDGCQQDETCATVRRCFRAENGTLLPCNSETDLMCGCIPPAFQVCQSQQDCTTVGETCIRFKSTLNQVCASKIAARGFSGDEAEIVDPESSAGPGTDPDSNLTSEAETHQHDNVTTNGNNTTIPNQPPPAAENNPSVSGESASGNQSLPAGGTVSEAPPPSVPTPTDDTGSVCIAAKYLSHVPRQELVFETHTLSSVLCDHHGSCATSGHIVYYKGSGMMMRTYCNIIDSGCEKRKMLVNSPKWRRGLRISSSSPGMEYTAFAARYETRTEERVLRTAVRMGL